MRPTRLVDFEGIARHHNVNIMLCKPKEDREKGCRNYTVVSLSQDLGQKRPGQSNHETIGRPLFLHQEDG